MDEATARSVLGVGPHAGQSELRRAFRLRSKATHPDLSGSTEAFAEVQTAYSVLAERVITAPTPWWLEDADAPKSRVASEQPSPRRGRFETMFREAIRKQRSS